MKLSTLVPFVIVLVAIGCVEPRQAGSTKPRMTQHEVLVTAEAAMIARFPGSFASGQPYHVQFADGNWAIWGTAPNGVLGGGTPEAVVRDSDGKVLDIHLSR